MHDSIPKRLFDRAKERPGAPAHYEKRDGRWRMTTWAELARDVRAVCRSLLALGFEPGQTVSILGYNRREWVLLDVAAMALGGAPAGVYTTCSHEEVQYIVHHAESPVVLLEDAKQWEKIQKELERLPKLRHAVMMRDAPKIDHPMVLGWEAFLEKGSGVDDARIDERLAAIEPGGLATLIYTSGTTGPPKGVMLSHDNLAFTATLAVELNHTNHTDRMLSYLPLSHIAEQMFTIHAPLTQGSAIYFAESIEKVPENLKEVQPTAFFGVPRIWEKFHAGVSAKLMQAAGAKRILVEQARRVGAEMSRCRADGEAPGKLLELQHRLFDKLVFSKLKQAIGLGNARICVSGAAPIAREVLEFFASLDILVLEVYGQSEDTGPTSFNVPGRCRLGTVGPVIPGVEVKFGDDEEILVRGRNVFLGYYKEPEATRETLVDGWLHTGDLGKLDRDGFLMITGRKKEIIITAGGKNISPKNIEGALKNHPLIGEVVVIGDRRKFLTALVALDPDAAKRFQDERRETIDPHRSGAIRAEIQKAVDAVNESLARVETVKKFHVLPRPLSIDTGELTPTLKVKRRVVAERYRSEIESMYEE